MTSNQQTTELDEELPLDGDDGEAHSELLDAVMKPFNPSAIDFVVETKSLDTIIKRIKNNEIDMNTDFQRHADLWDNHKMSRLIESIMIRLPLPAFYFDASKEDVWLIVDGLQRLSSIKKFVIDQKLRLSGLEFLTDLKGKTFDELPRQYQRRIEECQVVVYMIRPGTPDEVKYSVFRRINTGGLTLNTQEIRNALAKPDDRKLLEELASLDDSRKMLGDLSKRMRDQELVLRFWAFYRFDYLEAKHKKEMAAFLDRAMEDLKKGDASYREQFKNSYITAIQRSYQLLGENGFEKKPTTTKRSKNAGLFEAWMVELCKLNDIEFNRLLEKKDLFRSKVEELLIDAEFIKAISYSTQKKEHVEIRYSKVKNLISEVLNA